MNNPTRIKAASWFQQELGELQSDPTFVAEDIILDMTEQIHEAMAKRGMNQSDLAKRMAEVRGVDALSRSAVSQLLSGNQNISIRRLVEVALAMGMTITAPRLVPLAPPEIIGADDVFGTGPMVETTPLTHEDRENLWMYTQRQAGGSSGTEQIDEVSYRDSGSEKLLAA